MDNLFSLVATVYGEPYEEELELLVDKHNAPPPQNAPIGYVWQSGYSTTIEDWVAWIKISEQYLLHKWFRENFDGYRRKGICLVNIDTGEAVPLPKAPKHERQSINALMDRVNAMLPKAGGLTHLGLDL